MPCNITLDEQWYRILRLEYNNGKTVIAMPYNTTKAVIRNKESGMQSLPAA